ncbi:uncharacterized protein Z518_10839 [Rhinocladiella mackenziei CBS 650.93]|uniref:Cytochrome P450 n=1 Tax=Rhinocladiella mackenziei CBS 650.93 TaxID=1442369 RepID=A0A0D2FCU9_9EURO|nr:uncharacterized protein Z518_10839 [Rhinocladiella mackenziei CBS 650.93]KIW99911.1 hypothetical protein Z518_10839 [Rhinocladiella mackenziei CBS 650.93]
MASLQNLLSPSIGAISLLTLFCSYIFIGAVVNYRKLSQFNGPPLAGYSRFWLFWQAVNARVNTAEFEALRKYGSVCRIGPDLLLTDDPDIVRHMNAPGSRWIRSEWYDAMRLDPRLDSVFSTRDEKVHADLRAKEAGGVNIDTLEPDIDARVVDLVNLIKTTYDGITMDFSDVARFFTLDVLSTVAFGAPFGILAAAGPKETDKVGMGPVLAIARKAVAERYDPDPKAKKDMLGYFVDKGLNQLQCEVEANLQIVAGSDSTTTVPRSAMFLLTGSPSAYGKLRAEIDGAIGAGKMSFPVIKYSEAQKLPYLHACIWESLRVYPPLFGLKSKLAPPGGETMKGIFFPEGTEVGSCDAAMCR